MQPCWKTRTNETETLWLWNSQAVMHTVIDHWLCDACVRVPPDQWRCVRWYPFRIFLKPHSYHTSILLLLLNNTGVKCLLEILFKLLINLVSVSSAVYRKLWIFCALCKKEWWRISFLIIYTENFPLLKARETFSLLNSEWLYEALLSLAAQRGDRKWN